MCSVALGTPVVWALHAKGLQVVWLTQGIMIPHHLVPHLGTTVEKTEEVRCISSSVPIKMRVLIKHYIST